MNALFSIGSTLFSSPLARNVIGSLAGTVINSALRGGGARRTVRRVVRNVRAAAPSILEKRINPYLDNAYGYKLLKT